MAGRHSAKFARHRGHAVVEYQHRRRRAEAWHLERRRVTTSAFPKLKCGYWNRARPGFRATGAGLSDPMHARLRASTAHVLVGQPLAKAKRRRPQRRRSHCCRTNRNHRRKSHAACPQESRRHARNSSALREDFEKRSISSCSPAESLQVRTMDRARRDFETATNMLRTAALYSPAPHLLCHLG